MKPLLLLIQAELIKWRRSWTILAATLIPLSQVLFLCLIFWFSEDRVQQQGGGFISWYQINFTGWNMIFMPVCVAMVSFLSWSMESEARAWQHLLLQPHRKSLHFLNKTLSHLGLILISHGVFFLALLLCGSAMKQWGSFFLNMKAYEVNVLFQFSVLSMISSIPIIFLHTWYSFRFPGLGAALVLSALGIFTTHYLLQSYNWAQFLPWGASLQMSTNWVQFKLLPLSSWIYFLASLIVTFILGMVHFAGWEDPR